MWLDLLIGVGIMRVVLWVLYITQFKAEIEDCNYIVTAGIKPSNNCMCI